ncbi:MAG: hypothetical protein WCB90_02925 [Methanosarcina sp.]
MAKMTITEALEKLAEINNYDEIQIQTNAGEPTLIDFAIDDIRNLAEDPEEIFDLKVTEDNIRELDENGYIKSGEPLYRVVKDEAKQ